MIESPPDADPPADAGPPGSSSPAPAAAGPRRLRSLTIGSIIALALAIGLFIGLRPQAGTGSTAGPVVAIGSAAPGFTLPSLIGGGHVDLDALGKDRHHPVVLNFFASWCGPCREETPLLARTARAEAAHGSDIQFIGVDTLDPPSSAVPFVEQAGITYPVGTDDGRVTAGRYGLYGDPQTFFVDAGGTVIGHVRGPLNQTDLQHWLRRLATSTG